MEHKLTKKQAEALIMACRHWEDAIELITDSDSHPWHIDWLDHLQSVSYTHTLPVNMRELYDAMVQLCIALDAKIDKGELE